MLAPTDFNSYEAAAVHLKEFCTQAEAAGKTEGSTEGTVLGRKFSFTLNESKNNSGLNQNTFDFFKGLGMAVSIDGGKSLIANGKLVIYAKRSDQVISGESMKILKVLEQHKVTATISIIRVNE